MLEGGIHNTGERLTDLEYTAIYIQPGRHVCAAAVIREVIRTRYDESGAASGKYGSDS